MGWDIEYRLGLWWHWTIRQVEGFGTVEWTVLCAVMLGIGMVCLRGYGSRSGY